MDFEALWSFLTNTTNRETLGWIGAALLAVCGALWQLWRRLTRGPGKAPEPRVDNSARDGIAGSGHQFHGAVHVDNARKGSIWPLVILALFAAFAMRMAVQAGDPAGTQVRACAPGVVLSEDPRLAAQTLNSQGIRAFETGAYRRAVACFEGALAFDAQHWGYSENLVRVLARQDAEGGDAALALSEGMAERQLRDMRQFQKDERASLRGLSCQERLRFTNEAFDLDIWWERQRLFILRSRFAEAASDLTRPIETYPEESCAWPTAVGELLISRGLMQCLDGRAGGAIADVLHPLALDRQDPSLARQYQGYMAEAGVYGGPVDGDFGPASQAAFRDWAASGCSGLTEKLQALLRQAT